MYILLWHPYTHPSLRDSPIIFWLVLFIDMSCTVTPLLQHSTQAASRRNLPMPILCALTGTLKSKRYPTFQGFPDRYTSLRPAASLPTTYPVDLNLATKINPSNDPQGKSTSRPKLIRPPINRPIPAASSRSLTQLSNSGLKKTTYSIYPFYNSFSDRAIIDNRHLLLTLTKIKLLIAVGSDMKSSSTRKAYLLIPDLIREARDKEDRDNKENIPLLAQTMNVKIPVSKYLENTLNPKEKQVHTSKDFDPNQSSKSDSLFDQDTFIRRELEFLKLKQKPKDTRTHCLLAKSSTAIEVNESRLYVRQKLNTHSRKTSAQFKSNSNSKGKGKNSSDKKRLGGHKNLLQGIKGQKLHSRVLNNSSIPIEEHLRDIDNSSHQEIQPVLNFLEQLKNSDKLIFSPQKFQKFLDNIKGDQAFQKALRTFVYSYFIQNELND